MNLNRTLNELFQGAPCVSRASLLTAAAALALTGAASAQVVPQIGMKVGLNGNGGLQNGAAGALLSADLAGQASYAQTNWNNGGSFGANAAAFDSSGAATTVTFSWDSAGLWSQAGGGTPNIETVPDLKLMNGYCDSNASVTNFLDYTQPVDGYAGTNVNCKPWVYVQGLNAWMTANHVSQYDVVIYSGGDNNGGRGGEYWIQNATGPWTAPGMTLGSDVTTHSFICVNTVFVTGDQTYYVVPQTVLSGRQSQAGNWQGNVLAFNSLTNDSFLLRKNTYNFRAPINAIQIVPRAAPLPATIDPLLPAAVYTGGTAAFNANVAGIVPMSFHWYKGATALSDGGKVSGSATPSLKITGVSAADVASYSLVVSNVMGMVTSSVAPLTVSSPTPGSYAEKIFTNTPVAYWRLDDTGDPSTNYTVANESVGGFNGTYESAAFNAYGGALGPQPPAFPGFVANSGALQTSVNPHTWVIAPPLNLSNNTVTIAAWIFPTAFNEPGSAGLVWSRNGGDVSGLGYQNANQLGYTWNNAAATYNFASGLVVPSNIWSLVAVTVTPTNATLYLFNAITIATAVNSATTNAIAGFSGPTTIGVDPASAGAPDGRAFVGKIAQAAVFNYDVAPIELYNMYKKALGLAIIPATISSQPQSLVVYAGRPAVFNVTGSGDTPLTYQWRTNGVNLPNGGRISGATSAKLTVAGATPGDMGTYDVVVNNVANVPATSLPVTLTVVASNSAPVSYEAAVEAAGPIAYWRLNETNGSPFAYDYWGGNIATNGNVNVGVPGPQPPDFPGFETTNSANSYDGLSAFTDTQEPILNNLAQFSLVGWFNTSVAAELNGVGLFGQAGGVQVGFYPALGVSTPNAGTLTIPGTTNLTSGQWYMVAAIGDGHTLSVYLVSTGLLMQTSATITTTNYGRSPSSFVIGALSQSANFFAGQVDEVAAFNHALSLPQFSAIVGAALNNGPFPPTIISQPQSQTLYAGRTALLSASALATAPVTYQWREYGTNITDSGNLSGSATTTLKLTNLAVANDGPYELVITNPAGAVTSSVAQVTAVIPVPDSYESKIIAYNPLAYWRLNETNGSTIAYDYFGGLNGTYGATSAAGVPGPDNPPFAGFTATNTGVGISNSIAGTYVSVPFGTLGTNNASIVAWLYPVGLQNAWSGILVTRGGGGIEGGFNYNDQQMLAYTWNNNNQNTWGYISSLVVPSNTWSFAALVVYPDKGILYLGTTNSLRSATNAIPHTPDVFGDNWHIGNDGIGDPGRTFNGAVDEVAVFNYSLSPAQIQQLFGAANIGPNVTLTIQASGGKVTLTWAQGTLYQASSANGPWSAVNGNPSSPYQFTPTGAATFFRVKLQ
ncbi:MAG TPA: LamG-like jellyroll fold domain-containing protein [Candidatus Acidoferrum sp.]|jgi:hypothetical protein|nr:LamG-like jellyroll fold domain-containing protein [Candidatus Acidoferrum sp.]